MRRTDAQHDFARIPRAEIARSVFNRSCGLKTTLNAGLLVPIFVDEALPGDTFNMRASFFGRMATLIYPVFEDLTLDVFFFACPNRLVWDNWQRFNGEQRNPGDSTDFLVPVMVAPVGGHDELSLSDYFGIPTKVAGLEHTCLHHRAYSLIWNEWFRDENLQDSVTVDVDDGPDDPADYVVLRRGKRHDYFTSSLPFPQKGPSVELPLGLSAPVSISPLGDQEPSFLVSGSVAKLSTDAVGPTQNVRWSVDPGAPVDIAAWSDPKLIGEADLSSATAATINQIRQAFQIQRLLERDARGGSRYTEILRSHFGVTSDDARLQRPEYLGGGSMRINVNPVANTTTLDPAFGLGSLGAFATFSGSGIGFTKSFTEHSVVIGMVSIRADLTYQQGLDRMWSRRERLEFFWPALAHLGEQAVLSREIFADGSGVEVDGTGDFAVWGYQERYAEYRYKPSRVTGHMRSNADTPLDVWHLAQDFATRPLLNDVFIVDDPPIARVVAVPSEANFLMDAFFQFRCARPMPTYSVPGLIDHF